VGGRHWKKEGSSYPNLFGGVPGGRGGGGPAGRGGGGPPGRGGGAPAGRGGVGAAEEAGFDGGGTLSTSREPAPPLK